MKSKVLLSIISLLFISFTILVISCTKEPVPVTEFKVASVTPATGEAGVKYDSKIVIKFTRKPSAETAAGGGFVLSSKNTGAVFPVDVTYDGANIVTYTPQKTMVSQLEYKIDLKGVTADDKTVLPDFTSGFTVEKVPFKILSIVPADKATGVSINAPIVITFTKRVKAPTCAFGTGGATISFTTTLSTDGRIVTFTPKDPMKKNSLYGGIFVGATANDGDILPDYSFEFTTEN